MSGRRLRSSLVVLLALGLRPAAPSRSPPPRQPVADGGAARDRPAGHRAGTTVTDLRALADISVDRGGQRQQLSGVLLAQAPGSVRFEALSPFGQPILVAVVHDGQLTAYSAITNEAVVGEATAETTARLLGLPFEPEDLVAIVSGYAVPPRDVRLAEVLPADDARPVAVPGRRRQRAAHLDGLPDRRRPAAPDRGRPGGGDRHLPARRRGPADRLRRLARPSAT